MRITLYLVAGIGKGITELLLQKGCNVLIASRSSQKVETTAREFNEKYKVRVAEFNEK